MNRSIISYIKNSPYYYDSPSVGFDSLSTEELLHIVDGEIESIPALKDHTYEIIEVPDFAEAKQYKHYAPTWCIFESEKVFFEETHNGTCHFVFCKREDADNYSKLTFGDNYPYDNYGLSFIALLLTENNRLVSVTSRRNWDENFDHYLNNEQLKNELGTDLYNSTINPSPLRILHISDTHTQHLKLTNLPAADIIVHSGDFCFAGTEEEAFDFFNWFCDLPYRHKIFIPGNHDACLYGAKTIEGLDANCHYLCNSAVEIEGVKFYGVPFFMEDYLSGKHEKNIDRIPYDTDVLITHNPPLGILDNNYGKYYGDNHLLNKVVKIRPKLHLFGHIHDKPGATIQDGISFSNACCVDEKYNWYDNEKKIIELQLH